MSAFHRFSPFSSSALGVYPDPVGASSVVSVFSFFRLFLSFGLSTFNFELFRSIFNHSRLPSLPRSSRGARFAKGTCTRSANSFVSPSYAPLSRKSNYSRTYAKHRGWGCLPQNTFAYNSFVFFHCVNYYINCHCRPADILECGSSLPLLHAIVGPPTFLFPGKMCRASGAGNHHANRSQGLPFGSAQGRRPGLTCFAPTVLCRKGGHAVLQRTADARGAWGEPRRQRSGIFRTCGEQRANGDQSDGRGATQQRLPHHENDGNPKNSVGHEHGHELSTTNENFSLRHEGVSFREDCQHTRYTSEYV